MPDISSCWKWLRFLSFSKLTKGSVLLSGLWKPTEPPKGASQGSFGERLHLPAVTDKEVVSGTHP